MKTRIRIAAAASVILGIFFGALIPELLHMSSGTYAGLLSAYALQGFERTTPETGAMLYYILRSRITGLLLLWMSSYTALGLLFHIFILFWLGLSFGLLLSVFLLRQGYHGILLLLCGLLPQWIIYLSVLRKEFIFFTEKSNRPSDSSSLPSGSKIRRELSEFAKMLSACLVGCILETWFGMYVFRLFLHVLQYS
jgi:hypothetical protein